MQLDLNTLGNFSSVRQNLIHTEKFSTDDNDFYPLFIIHCLYLRTSKEIVYQLPWATSYSGVINRWRPVTQYLKHSEKMIGVKISDRYPYTYVCKGYACEILPDGSTKTLFVVATYDLDYLMNLKRGDSIDSNKFFLVQSIDFIENPAYKNLRSQYRRIYINPIKIPFHFKDFDAMDKFIKRKRIEISPGGPGRFNPETLEEVEATEARPIWEEYGTVPGVNSSEIRIELDTDVAPGPGIFTQMHEQAERMRANELELERMHQMTQVWTPTNPQSTIIGSTTPDIREEIPHVAEGDTGTTMDDMERLMDSVYRQSNPTVVTETQGPDVVPTSDGSGIRFYTGIDPIDNTPIPANPDLVRTPEGSLSLDDIAHRLREMNHNIRTVGGEDESD